MNKVLKALSELSELREQFHDDDAPEEKLAELSKRMLEKEKEFRAACEEQAEAETRADDRLDELRGEVSIGRYLQHGMEERAVSDGAEAELNKEMGVDERSFPWDALLPRNDGEERDEEHRVDAAAAVADAAIGRNNQAVLRRVFKRTDAAYCGISMPSVAPGIPNYPVMTAGTTGEMKAAGAEVDAKTTTFTGMTLEPRRGTARYLYRVEDAAKFSGLEGILRDDIRAVMGQLLDDQVVAGAAASPNSNGFLTQAKARVGNAPTAKATLAGFVKAYSDEIDGLYAYDASGARMLIGLETFKFLRAERTTVNNRMFIEDVRTAGGGLRMSTRVAAAASDLQNAYTWKPAEVRAYAPVWQGVTMIRDPYSGAAKGEIALTLLMLFGFGLVRGAPQTVQFKLA